MQKASSVISKIIWFSFILCCIFHFHSFWLCLSDGRTAYIRYYAMYLLTDLFFIIATNPYYSRSPLVFSKAINGQYSMFWICVAFLMEFVLVFVNFLI